MRKGVFFGADGAVRQVITGRTLPEGAFEVDVAIPDADLAGLMQDAEGALVARPVSPVPVLTGAGEYAVLDCPAGTVIEVHDCLGRELMAAVTAEADGYSETVTLPDRGTYEIIVSAPPPHVVWRLKVEV